MKSIPDISKWNVYKVNDISGLFSDCYSLTSLPNISNWFKDDNPQIENPKFIYDNLKCDISKFSFNKENTGKNISQIFYNCSSLKTLPDLSKWNTRTFVVLKGMFYGCSSLII